MKLTWQNTIYSNTSKPYISNPEPEIGDEIKVSIKMLKESPVTNVVLSYLKNGDEQLTEMEKYKTDDVFKYYVCDLEVNEPQLKYRFRIYTSQKRYYYNRSGTTTYTPTRNYDFEIMTDHQLPKWIKSAVFYQIMPDRFYNGDFSNDVQTGEYQFRGNKTVKKEWSDEPSRYAEDYCLDFFGGDLAGIKEKIPYLKELGVNALYLMPIFRAATHHKYDVIDYFKIDPYFGDEPILEELVTELHNNDIKIILDMPINHTGVEHKWFNKERSFFPKKIGAYNNLNNEKREYYFFNEDNNYEVWLEGDKYPALNYTSDRLRNIIYKDENSVLKKWIKNPFDIDGYRFDAANALGKRDKHQVHKEVWSEIRANIKEIKPESYLVGESWIDAQEFLQGDMWDGATNYFGFCQPIRSFLGQTKYFDCPNYNAEELAQAVNQYLLKLPYRLALSQFNFLDSHDIERLHNNSELSFASYRVAVIMLFTFPGVPSIYYGDEICLQGDIDEVEGARYPMEWEEKKQNKQFYKLYKKLIAVRKNEAALQTGGFKILYAKGNVFAYARFINDKVYLIVVSQAEDRLRVEIPVGLVGVTQQVEIKEVFNQEVSYVIEEELVDLDNTSYVVIDGQMKLELNAEEGLLFEIKR